MAKEISFSEFLKEGALNPEPLVAQETISAEKPIRIVASEPVTNLALKEFWKDLRHFFRTADRPQGKNGLWVPALLAPYLKSGKYTNDYPVFISAGGERCIPLEDLIQETFNTCFGPEEAKILRINLPRILKDLKAETRKDDFSTPFEKAWPKAEADLRKVDVHGDRKEGYLADIEKLKKSLPASGQLLRFSDACVFLMLQAQLNRGKSARQKFLETVEGQILALKERLAMEARRSPDIETGQNEKGFAFADQLISFKKMGALMPKEGAEGLSEERIERIKSIVGRLEKGPAICLGYSAHVVITQSLFEAFEWPKILSGAQLQKAGPNEGYKCTEDAFDQIAADFAQFMAAQRMASLELQDAYNPAVHDDFYKHFNWHHLSAQEMQLCPPTLFIGETHGFLQNNLTRFSSLLSLNKPIRLIAIDRRLVNTPNPDISWEDASHGYHQELSAIAIAHRSTHTFQCAVNQAVDVYVGMQQCLSVDAPSIMHFLLPESDEIKMVEILKLSAAVEGRFFPSITYDLQQGHQWGRRFNISLNPQPDKDWPQYDWRYQDADGSLKSCRLDFTYADYKAITREKVEELMLVPESCNTEDLLHISDYLRTPVEALTGKVPYIWLVSEQNILQRAALPYMWVVSCQERLDNWNYIQELGGVNSYHVAQALEREKALWEKQKGDEIDAIQKASAAAVESAKKTAADAAMERLTDVLLGQSFAPLAVLTSPPVLDKTEKKEKITEEAPEASPQEEKAPLISREAWLESFRCTTCNECTEKFPHIFAYNEDKQAIIKDPSKGSYYELVTAAEACPAACIHPGQPLNPAEKDLPELQKRAAKFN